MGTINNIAMYLGYGSAVCIIIFLAVAFIETRKPSKNNHKDFYQGNKSHLN